MNLKILTLAQSLSRAYLRIKPKRLEFDNFKESLSIFLNSINESETEEHNKVPIRDFLKSIFYNDNEINTKARNDLVIYLGKDTNSKSGVLIEVKHPNNKNEMVAKNNLNAKAMYEVILYYLRERIEEKNDELKHIIITNAYEWFIFDAQLFEKHFYKNSFLKKEYETWMRGGKVSSKTEHFYNEIAPKALESVDKEFEFIHFDLREFKKYLKNQKDEAKLIHLYKIFSTHHLLKELFASDGYSLDKQFYQELLHIIGLEEIKEGSKKLIDRKAEERREGGSLIENTINKLKTKDITKHIPKPESFGGTEEVQLYNIALELCITWINRILFLKLLEAQLVKYHNGAPSYKFLDIKTIKEYDDLHELFHEVLAIRIKDRYKDILEKFKNIPYLNSSLFEINDLERATIEINGLKDRFKLSIYGHTILKENGKTQTEPLSTLHYLLKFLDAYDFSSESSNQEVQEEEKRLISASVLGLIFEKINGYKDGSFFTPGFITMYMCRETLRRAVLQKFKDVKGWQCETIDELKDKIIDRKEANEIINSLKICDPGVGSGHYLVSALNELIAIKSELGILCYRDGSRIKYHKVEIQNDELIITDEENDEIFNYCLSETNKPINEKQKLQEAIFHEKEIIIENCLFGVDINPNSVSICRLRLWIELLKNAYYTQESNYTELETLPNIDINIKQGNSLISRFELHNKLSSLPPPTQQKMKLATEKYKEQVFIYKATDDKAVKEQTRKRIKELKEEFASIINPKDKDYIRLKELEADLAQQVLIYDRKEVAEWEKKTENLHKEKEKLEKAYNEKLKTLYGNAFEWRFEFPEVLDGEGNFIGFDVVIGNPPYIGFQDLTMKEYYNPNYQSAKGKYDIYVLFIELISKIANSSSYNGFILPHKFLIADFGTETRKFATKKKFISKIIHFGQEMVFEDATNYTCITFFSYDNKHVSFIKCNPNEIIFINEKTLEKIKYEDLKEEGWFLANSDINNILEKVRTSGQPLYSIFEGIFQGIVSGDNDAFYLYGCEEKNDLTILGYSEICDDKIEIEKKICRPLLSGKNMNKWLNDFDNMYIIYPYFLDSNKTRLLEEEDLKSSFPKAYNYFLSIKERLSSRGSTKMKYQNWYALWNARNLLNLSSQKILTPDICLGTKMSIDQTGKYFHNDTSYSLVKKNSIENPCTYFLGILNSKLIWFFLSHTGNIVRGGYFRFKTKYLEPISIPLPSKNKIDVIRKLVEEILENKKSSLSTNTNALESEIDQLVCQLYGLTEEEIKIVENA